MILAATQAQSQTLGTFIFTVASGCMVVLLGYVVRTFRNLLKQHYWLIEQVNTNSEALKTQGKAIESLLKDRREARRQRE